MGFQGSHYGGRRVLITGGAGFIGSHLSDHLLEKGYNVLGMDNFITGSEENIAHLKGVPDYEFIRHDITKPFVIPGTLEYILNFASPASPVDYYKYPIETLTVGSIGSHNCLDLARDKGARIVVASTSEVYGDPLVHPQREDYWGNVNSIGPRSCYDEAKRYMEAATMSYRRAHKVNTGIVRIFNTYGPRMRLSDGRVVPNIIPQALLNEPITVFGDGSQTRSFCYVSDLVRGIIALMESDYPDPVNCGNPTELTILTFAQKIKAVTGSTSEIVFKELPADDPKVRKPDITRARAVLGWEPVVSLDEGLAKTIEYFRTKVGKGEMER